MSPPPMEATRCQPSTRAITVTAISSHSCGSITNQTVSTPNATSAPRLRTFLPGSISGLDLIRAESLRNATIEPVKVTAPMKTPMNTSAEWIPVRSWASSSSGLGAVGVALDVQVAVPADQHRGQTDEGVQQRDQLGHPGHLDHPGPPQPDRGADQHRHHQQREPGPGDVAVDRERDRGHQGHRHAGDAEGVAGLGGLVVGQPGQRQDEQQGGDDVRRLRGRSRQSSDQSSARVSSSRTWRASGGSPRSHRRR